MKKLKKTFKIILIILLALIGFAFAAPYLFKNQIVALVKKEINKNINAKVDFKDVDISFFRHFPKVAVALNGLNVTGSGNFIADTLIAAKRVDATLDIMSVIKAENMNIYSVFIDEPKIHAIVNKQGFANWNIIKIDTSSSTEAASTPFKMQLTKYEITNGFISYKDEESNMSSEVLNLNHKGSGDFTADLFTLKTTTTADAVTFIYEGIPYLAKVKTVTNADIAIDNIKNTYSYQTDNIVINELKISSKGVIKNLLENGWGIDIDFKAPSTDFKNILSLIPVIYQKDFSQIKTSGTALFSGFIKGAYNATSMPAYNVDIAVKDGFFKYPDLPKPVQHINFIAKINNPDGQSDNTIVDVQNGHIELDNEPFDFRLLVKNPISDMYIDAAAKGKLDLAKLSQMVKLEKGTSIAGLLNADVSVKGKVAAIEKQQYNNFDAAGNLSLLNFLYKANDYPQGVKINELQTIVTPQKIDINSLNGQYLSTNFSGTGQINNLLNYIFQNKALNANLNVSADQLNLNDWMGTSTDTTTTGVAAAPFVVPNNLDVTIIAKVGKVNYDKTNFENLNGALQIKDETVFIKNVTANALDGTMGINGQYSTALSKVKPDIVLAYDVKGLDVQKTFYAFNTVQKIMPIGKFIAGKLTSQLTMRGKLGDNMMPDLTTLTGGGNLFLIEGFLSKFAPLEKIAAVLSVKALEKISLKDVKNYIEFSNGKVMVKPFTVKVEGVEMEIGGLQGFDQSLDYIINMKVPRTLMGTKGNDLINNLATQVHNKGVPLNVGEKVNLTLSLGGFIKTPIVKTNLKQDATKLVDQLKQQATDFAKAKIDSTKQAVTTAVKDTIKSLKNQAISSAKDELAKKLFKDTTTAAKGDSTNKKVDVKESAKGLLKDLFKKKTKDTTTKQ